VRLPLAARRRAVDELPGDVEDDMSGKERATKPRNRGSSSV
jgi:hypothetical protein